MKNIAIIMSIFLCLMIFTSCSPEESECFTCYGDKEIKCPDCFGHGDRYYTCYECGGEGNWINYFGTRVYCDSCQGRGRNPVNDGSVCWNCDGKGILPCKDCIEK